MLAGGGGRRGAVAGRNQGDLVAEPGQGLLVVADEVLAVAAVPLLVVVLAGLGVVLAAAEDRPGDADQGAGDRDRGFLLVALACYLTSEVSYQGFCRFVRRVAVCEYGLRVIMCTRQRTHDRSEGRDGQLARACR